jgi:hypothetical protein
LSLLLSFVNVNTVNSFKNFNSFDDFEERKTKTFYNVKVMFSAKTTFLLSGIANEEARSFIVLRAYEELEKINDRISANEP